MASLAAVGNPDVVSVAPMSPVAPLLSPVALPASAVTAVPAMRAVPAATAGGTAANPVMLAAQPVLRAPAARPAMPPAGYAPATAPPPRPPWPPPPPGTAVPAPVRPSQCYPAVPPPAQPGPPRAYSPVDQPPVPVHVGGHVYYPAGSASALPMPCAAAMPMPTAQAIPMPTAAALPINPAAASLYPFSSPMAPGAVPPAVAQYHSGQGHLHDLQARAFPPADAADDGGMFREATPPMDEDAFTTDPDDMPLRTGTPPVQFQLPVQWQAPVQFPAPTGGAPAPPVQWSAPMQAGAAAAVPPHRAVPLVGLAAPPGAPTGGNVRRIVARTANPKS